MIFNFFLYQEADLAITDLTVTSERIKALEFTPSIMNLGKNLHFIENYRKIFTRVL